MIGIQGSFNAYWFPAESDFRYIYFTGLRYGYFPLDKIQVGGEVVYGRQGSPNGAIALRNYYQIVAFSRYYYHWFFAEANQRIGNYCPNYPEVPYQNRIRHATSLGLGLNARMFKRRLDNRFFFDFLYQYSFNPVCQDCLNLFNGHVGFTYYIK